MKKRKQIFLTVMGIAFTIFQDISMLFLMKRL